MTRKEMKNHKCLSICQSCLSTDCNSLTIEPERIAHTCRTCNNEFKTTKCFNAHFKDACKRFKKCEVCNALIRGKREKHDCSVRNCSTCNEQYRLAGSSGGVLSHKCYMSKKIPNGTFDINVYFDIESIINHPETGKHEAVALCSLKTCEHCSKMALSESSYECNRCCGHSKKRFIYNSINTPYEGTNVCDQFLDYIFQQERKCIENKI